MTQTVKFIVVPFRLLKARFQQAEMRVAATEERAHEIAEILSQRFAGVAAFEVLVDQESGDMLSPRLLVKFGRIPDLDLDSMAA